MRKVAMPVGSSGGRLGTWAWLLQRLSALALVLLVALHLYNPFVRPVQHLLLAVVLIHLFLGLRTILLDAGVAHPWHRSLFGGALLAATVVFAAIWLWRWY